MKKGFTLVEIMASIIILSVIMMIGVGVYKQVDKKIREQQYKNKITYIENQAALYGSETGYIETTVQILVNTGYIEADTNDGRVIDPRYPKDEEKDLNHHVVEIRREGENYYGHFLEDKQEEDTNNLDQTNKNLEIIVTTVSGKEIEEDNWTKENVILTYNITGNNPQKVAKVIWFDNINSLQGKKEDSITVETGQFLNTEYRVEVTFEDGTKYEAKRVVKIDKQAPVIYKNNIKIEKEKDWTNKPKNVTILASDQNGSGIEGYAVVAEKDYKKCNQIENYDIPKGNKEIYNTELDEGKHYICVKDKAGNYNDDSVTNPGNSPLPEIKVDKIDKTKPECKIEVVQGQTAKQKNMQYVSGYENWYVEPISFSVVEDEEKGKSPSGILRTIAPESINTDVKDETVIGQIINGAGTIGKCELTVNVDVTKPTCTWIGEAPHDEAGTYRWEKERNIQAKCSDTGSGCANKALNNYTRSYNNNDEEIATEDISFLSDFYDLNVYDKVGHFFPCRTTLNVYQDTKPPSFGSLNIENANGVQLKQWKDNSDENKGYKSGFYDSNWSRFNVHTVAKAYDGGVDGVTITYTTTGSTENVNNASGSSRNIKAHGTSTITYRACDKLNNCASNGPLTVKIDKQGPTVVCNPIMGEEAKSYCGGPQDLVYCTYTDEESGIQGRKSALIYNSNLTQLDGRDNCSSLSGQTPGPHDRLCTITGIKNKTFEIRSLCDKAGNCVKTKGVVNSTGTGFSTRPVTTKDDNLCE